MMRRFRRSYRALNRRIGRIARNATMPMTVKRFVIDELSVPADGGTNFSVPLVIPLLTSVDGGTNAETESDGTNIAECNPYSRVVKIKGSLKVIGLSSGDVIRYMLYKDEDNEGMVTSLQTQFHNSNDDASNRELRARILSKGILVPGSGGYVTINLGAIRRKTLRRLGLMKENDRIELAIAGNDASSPGTVNGFGSIYVREN